MASRSTIAWFEIPAADFERAITFYQTILGIELLRQTLTEGIQLAVFPYQKPGVSGCVVHGGPYRPGGDGVVIYLNCDGQLDAVIGRVAAAGGSLAGPKIELPDAIGSFIHITDTEGNRVGLHAVP